MEDLWSILKSTLLVVQFIAALVGCFYFFTLKESYWKWFSVYLVIIFLQEFIFTNVPSISDEVNNLYNLFFGIPVQFIFLYWLYALKSLQNKRLFILCILLLVITVVLFAFSLGNTRAAIDLVTNTGSLLLIVLVVLEFFKQIKNDDILKFKENKMFYVNLGVVLFYVGSLPFQVFQSYLYKDYTTLINYYYLFFLTANSSMYLLFTASFIWGKQQSY